MFVLPLDCLLAFGIPLVLAIMIAVNVSRSACCHAAVILSLLVVQSRIAVFASQLLSPHV